MNASLLLCFLVLAVLFTMQLSHWRRQKRLTRWEKALHIKKHAALFQKLFASIDGFQLSKAARSKQDAPEYLYGEIDFIPYIALLSLAHLDKNTCFYDLGSGTGKAVIACAMTFPVQKAVGVELFSGLYTCSQQQKKKLAREPEYRDAAATIDFIHGDFLDTDLQDATHIFINATAIFQPTWGILSERLVALPRLKTVITTSKPLASEQFTVCHKTQVQMSWGVVDAYLQMSVSKPIENIE